MKYMPKYPSIIMIVVSTFFFVSCDSDSLNYDSADTIEETAADQASQESDYVNRYFMGTAVKVRSENDGTYSLAGSDTRLFENQLSESADAYDSNPIPIKNVSGLAVNGGVRKWSDNTIVYTISGLSSQVRSELQKSFDEWSSKTNVRFKQRTNESTYVTISSSGSNSNSGVATLGSNGSRGFIRLGTRATAVVIIHEIGHTLGYIHEQNRSDRDNYVIVNYNNIQDDAQDQFYKSTSAALVTSQLDLNSTMMYGSYTFSKNGRPTITDLNGNTYPQRQARISTGDIAGTNAVYPGEANGGAADVCSQADEWSRSRRYSVGDLVTYQGGLYERDFTRWNYIKNCG